MLFQFELIKRQPPLRPSLNQQQGAVIVLALFVVAIVATMSYLMLARLQRDTHRTLLMMRNVQAELYAQGSIAWAMDQLRNSWQKQKANQVVDVMPLVSPEDDKNGYKIVSVIYDMQARFNVNNVTSTAGQLQFMTLLRVLNPQLSEEKAREVTLALSDWINPSVQDNVYHRYYNTLSTPYRAAHLLMVSATELRLIKGMTPSLYRSLQPYVVALPQSTTAINVQTAKAPVLASLSPALNLEAAMTIERLRETKPFISPQDFLNLEVIKNRQIVPEHIVTLSQYFLVETKVSIEKQHVVLYTLLERAGNQKKPIINVLWQSKGTW